MNIHEAKLFNILSVGKDRKARVCVYKERLPAKQARANMIPRLT